MHRSKAHMDLYFLSFIGTFVHLIFIYQLQTFNSDIWSFLLRTIESFVDIDIIHVRVSGSYCKSFSNFDRGCAIIKIFSKKISFVQVCIPAAHH